MGGLVYPATLNRFGLKDGNFVDSDDAYSNLWWFYQDKRIGYGDLSHEDLVRISLELRGEEAFEARRDHHLRSHLPPVIRVTPNHIEFGKGVTDAGSS